MSRPLSALCAALLLFCPDRTGAAGEEPGAGKGVIVGSVRYRGPIPKPVPVPGAGTSRPVIEVEEKTGGLKDAVVWLEGVPAQGAAPIPKTPAVMDQVNFFFIPHVLTIRAGQQVEFLNSDSANHGVLAASFEPKNVFNAVTPPGGSYKHTFLATRRPIQIGCPYHAGMRGWIHVFEHPYHTVTSSKGVFRLPPVPPGRYTLHVRHQEGGLRREVPVEVKAGNTLELNVELAEAREGDGKQGPR